MYKCNRPFTEESQLQWNKNKSHKTRKLHAHWFTQGENGGYKPSSLGGRSILVVSSAGKQTEVNNFTSNAHLGCLKGSIALITLYQYTYLHMYT